MTAPRNAEAAAPPAPSSPRARNGTRVFVVALILTVAVVGGIPYAVASRDARRPPIQELPVELDLPSGSSLDSLQSAIVIEVTSGETLRVRLGGKDIAIRYLGVATPLRGQKCYREALDRNRLLVGSSLLRSQRVLVLNDPAGIAEDAFYVFNEEGVSINATLIAEGYASASAELGHYGALLKELEGTAQANGRGCLWSSDSLHTGAYRVQGVSQR